MRFGRNLTASEILDQALEFRRAEPVNHAVFMGMGEPMMNFDAVISACERLPDIGVATSHTTVSTVGWIPGIERLATEGPRVRLALSLHAPDDALRSELMPVNDRYPLADVLDACRAWRAARRKRVYVEYLMLAGVNDSSTHARALAEILAPHEAFKVNLIPYNPTDGGFDGSDPETIEAFRARLAERGVPGDRAPHPGPRHRRRLWPARRRAGGRRRRRLVGLEQFLGVQAQAGWDAEGDVAAAKLVERPVGREHRRVALLGEHLVPGARGVEVLEVANDVPIVVGGIADLELAGAVGVGGTARDVEDPAEPVAQPHAASR